MRPLLHSIDWKLISNGLKGTGRIRSRTQKLGNRTWGPGPKNDTGSGTLPESKMKRILLLIILNLYVFYRTVTIRSCEREGVLVESHRVAVIEDCHLLIRHFLNTNSSCNLSLKITEISNVNCLLSLYCSFMEPENFCLHGRHIRIRKSGLWIRDQIRILPLLCR